MASESVDELVREFAGMFDSVCGGAAGGGRLRGPVGAGGARGGDSQWRRSRVSDDAAGVGLLVAACACLVASVG